jgi:hypothetical protein
MTQKFHELYVNFIPFLVFTVASKIIWAGFVKLGMNYFMQAIIVFFLYFAQTSGIKWLPV